MHSDDEDEDNTCPLCVEEMDLSDQNFLPCPCGYKVCMWCWHHIRENLNGLCPACRTPYNADPHAFSAVDRKEIVKLNREQKLKMKLEKKMLPPPVISISGLPSKAPVAPTVVERKHLHNYRVVQRNLVYVIGVPMPSCSEEQLRKAEFFGQYGKIGKVVIHRNHTASHSSVSAYITFAYKEDARACIHALDSYWLEGHVLRASFGTTKYCNNFIRGVVCNNPDCVYLHDLGDDDDRFTKEEIQAGHSKLMQVPGKDQSIVTGMGGPSGTGRRPAGETYLPPPVFIQDNAKISRNNSLNNSNNSNSSSSSSSSSNDSTTPAPPVLSRNTSSSWSSVNSLTGDHSSSQAPTLSIISDAHEPVPAVSENTKDSSSSSTSSSSTEEKATTGSTTRSGRSSSTASRESGPVPAAPETATTSHSSVSSISNGSSSSNGNSSGSDGAAVTDVKVASAAGGPKKSQSPNNTNTILPTPAETLLQGAKTQSMSLPPPHTQTKPLPQDPTPSSAKAAAKPLELPRPTPPLSDTSATIVGVSNVVQTGFSTSSTQSAIKSGPPPLVQMPALTAVKPLTTAPQSNSINNNYSNQYNNSSTSNNYNNNNNSNNTSNNNNNNNSNNYSSNNNSNNNYNNSNSNNQSSTLFSFLYQNQPLPSASSSGAPAPASTNGFSRNAVFPVPVSSLAVSVWASILQSSGEVELAGNDPFRPFALPFSELLDLTLPPVDAVSNAPWPKPQNYYSQRHPKSDVSNSGQSNSAGGAGAGGINALRQMLNINK